MLKLDNMDRARIDRLGTLAAHVVEHALASGLAATSYLVSSLAPVIGWARTVRPASLFYWAVGSDQLTAGPSVTAWAVLLLSALVLHALAVVLVQRLDIR